MSEKVIILGGGVAGMRAAVALNDLGVASVLIEKGPQLGGRVRNYDTIFPSFHSGKELVARLESQVAQAPLVRVLYEETVDRVEGDAPRFTATLGKERSSMEAGAILIATGFDPFDASQQEEYGYGIYKNVVTGTELEQLLDPEGPTGGEIRKPSDGSEARRVAIVFCVGSRSEKLGHNYCSRVCCSYSTKQAIEIKERQPDTSVVCFYIDVRTYGRGFEEMYRRAQEMGVVYVRGRVAECGMLPNGDITVRAENTLLGKPMQGVFDLVSLSHGMTPCLDAPRIARMLDIELAHDGFPLARDSEGYPCETTRDGVFAAGAAIGLKPIADCIADGDAAAARITAFLKNSPERPQ